MRFKKPKKTPEYAYEIDVDKFPIDTFTMKTNYRKVIVTHYSWIILLFSCSYGFSQDYTYIFDMLYSSASLEQKMHKADSLITLFETKEIDSLAYIYIDYAYWLFDVPEKEKAILFAKKGLDLGKERIPQDVQFLQDSAFDLGFYYAANNQPVESIRIYHEAISLNMESNAVGKIYTYLGNAHSDLNDLYKAYDYYELAIARLLDSGGNKHILRNVCQNMAATCFQIKTKESLEKGRKYGKIADSLATVIRTSSNNRFGIKLNLALLHNEEEHLDFEIALKYYNEALDIAEQENDTLKINRIYQGLGDLYNIIDQGKSIDFFGKAIALTDKTDTLRLGGLYFGLGHTYSIKKDYPQSLTYRHKGLRYFTGNSFMDPKTITNDFLLDFEDKVDLLFYLPQLAETYLNYFEANKDPLLLEKSILYFKMSDYLIDLLKINSTEFRSRLFWRELSTDIYGKAIRACYLNNQVEDAFYFMEKNKALLLIEDIAREKFKRSVQLPMAIIDREAEIKKRLIQNQSYFSQTAYQTKQKIDSLKQEEINIKRMLFGLQDSIGSSFLDFDFEPSILSLNEVQKNLDIDEVALEYHISIDDGYGIYTNKENGYVLFITNEQSYFFEIQELSALKKEILQLIDSFKTPFKSKQDIAIFNERSHTIYTRLFPSEIVRDLIKNKKVIIAPDSYLSLLPFETLSTSNTETVYLIKSSEIRYLYSNSFLKNNKKRAKSSVNFIGIAPGSFSDSDLSTLHNSRAEIDNLKNYYPGRVLVDTMATKTNFLNTMESASIIHLATHANAEGNRTPWIAFNDEKIILEELYLTKNNASLVVLSGCNTNIGKQEIGEGVISLARGFFYSGSQSVVSSLWSIDDRSTAEIVNNFYKNLHDGQSKSQALHNAKITYLDHHNLSEASPHFWASLILLGENDILKNSSNPWVLVFSIVLGLFLIGYLFSQSRKR